MSHDHYPDSLLRGVLRRCRTIAMVGTSANWVRPSYFVMKYLQSKGFRIIPVNPGVAGGEILGATVYASLADIPGRFDMVDIFRNSEAAGPVANQAIAVARDKGGRAYFEVSTRSWVSQETPGYQIWRR